MTALEFVIYQSHGKAIVVSNAFSA